MRFAPNASRSAAAPIRAGSALNASASASPIGPAPRRLRGSRSVATTFAVLLSIGTSSLIPRIATAASCCAGATVVPGRLMLHEELLVGLDLRAGRELGAYDARGRFTSSSGREVALEEGLFASLRVIERGQLAMRLPLLQTFREAGPHREIGGGVGDLQLAGRWDFVGVGESMRWPGIAAVASASLPTGRAPEGAQRLLGTDVTGLGALLFMGGLELEELWGPFLASASASIGGRAAREVRGAPIPSALLWSATGTAAFLLPGTAEATLALSSTFTAEPAASRRWLRVAASAGASLNDHWRLQGSVFVDPPLDGAGNNQPSSLGATFVWIRSWS